MRSIASFALIAAGMTLTSACASANGQDIAENSDEKDAQTKIVKRHRDHRVIRVGDAAEDIMNDKDTDGDGRISTKEYYTGPNQGRFDAIDTDEDGYIDKAELDNTLDERFSRMVDRLDGHKWVSAHRLGEGGDFVIDMEGMDAEIEIKVREAHKMAEEAMAQVEVEMSQLRERMGDDEFFVVAPHIEGFRLDEEELQAMKEERQARVLKKLDKNGDGAVSRDEFATRTNKKFDKLDKDEDGKLSGEELERYTAFGAFGAFELPHLADGAVKWEFHTDDGEEESARK